MENSSLKQLNKAYETRLRILHKDIFNNKMIKVLDSFVEHLRYIRDTFIISNIDNNDLRIRTITAAIYEFEAYRAEVDNNKKEFHWNNFCEFVKSNMEEWLSQDVTI